MRCASARNHFDELFDGRLEDGVRRRVEEHLAGCSRCAESYRTMHRILVGVRRMPRPAAPHLEVSPPAGMLPEPAVVAVRRRFSVRALAAASLFLALVVTHAIAFWLGDNRNRELAGIARAELPGLVDAHLDRTATQLRVARALAEEDPAAASRLALRAPLGDDLRRRSHAFLSVSHEPGLRSIRDRFERYVRRQDAVFSASDPLLVQRELRRLEQDLEGLIRVRQDRAAPIARLDAPRNTEDSIRIGIQLLFDNRPAAAGEFMARFALKHDDPRLAGGQLCIMLESIARIGEVRQVEAVQRLVHLAGRGGVRMFFGDRGAGNVPQTGGVSFDTQVIMFRAGAGTRPVAVSMRTGGPFSGVVDVFRAMQPGVASPRR